MPVISQHGVRRVDTLSCRAHYQTSWLISRCPRTGVIIVVLHASLRIADILPLLPHPTSHTGTDLCRREISPRTRT